MNLRACILLASSLPLVGCQTSGETSEVDRQARLLAAVPTNYRQIVPAAFRTVVPDPSGIRSSEISTPFLGSSNVSPDTPLVCVRVQYANGPGGQTGAQTIAFVFDDGRVIDSQWNSPACAGATYSLFPEIRTAYPALASPPA